MITLRWIKHRAFQPTNFGAFHFSVFVVLVMSLWLLSKRFQPPSPVLCRAVLARSPSQTISDSSGLDPTVDFERHFKDSTKDFAKLPTSREVVPVKKSQSGEDVQPLALTRGVLVADKNHSRNLTHALRSPLTRVPVEAKTDPLPRKANATAAERSMNVDKIKSSGGLSNLTQISNTGERFLIYQCQSTCKHWTETVNGVVLAYTIASLTNRTFGIQIFNSSCPLTDALQPNQVNWSLAQSLDLESQRRLYAHLSLMPLDKVASTNLDIVFKERVVFFEHKVDRIGQVFAFFEHSKTNTLYTKQLEWTRDLSGGEIFSVIYRKLFRLASPVQARLDSKLTPTRGVPRLICGQLDVVSTTSQVSPAVHWERLLSFLQSFDPASNIFNASLAENIMEPRKALNVCGRETLEPGNERTTETGYGLNVQFFVVSDSAEVLAKAEHLFGDSLIKSDRDIINTGNLTDTSSGQPGTCQNVTKDVVDLHLLSACDVLVVSNSPFGSQAAYLRGANRNLYCLMPNEQPRPCSLGEISEIHEREV